MAEQWTFGVSLTRSVARQIASAVSQVQSSSAELQAAAKLIGGIQRQVELIVNHMLDLGRTSSQLASMSRELLRSVQPEAA